MSVVPGVIADRTLVAARLATGAEPVDIRIARGRIAAITPTDTEAPSGEPIDLDGRALIAGLWDNHAHLNQWAATSRRFDVSSARSARAAADLVASGQLLRPEVPIVGVGFRDGLWPDSPTAAVLDAVMPERPVVLISADLHSCWLNSAALAHFAPGESHGLVREEVAFAVQRMLDDVPVQTMDDWVAEAGRVAASRGVVGIVDFEMAWNIDTWRRRTANGFDSQRIEFGIYPQHLERALADGLRSGDAVNDLVTVGSLKVITDGSLNSRTAYCFHPYAADGHDEFGALNVSPGDLRELMARAWEGGLRSAIHAIGDRANALALDAFDAVGCAGSIEHAQLLADADVPRFATLDVIASVQPEHAMDDRDMADRYWSAHTARAFVLRSLADVGARLAFGSDAPVAPLDPWVTIAAATSRTRDGRLPWHPEQAVSVDAALAASTRNSIAVGGVADFVATDIDPLEATDQELRQMPVSLTVLGGRITHQTL